MTATLFDVIFCFPDLPHHLQGAIFITATAPLHCDPLGLVNALAEDSSGTDSDSQF